MGIAPGELPNSNHTESTVLNIIIRHLKNTYIYGTCEHPLGAKCTSHGSKMPAVDRFQ